MVRTWCWALGGSEEAWPWPSPCPTRRKCGVGDRAPLRPWLGEEGSSLIDDFCRNRRDWSRRRHDGSAACIDVRAVDPASTETVVFYC